MSEQEHKSSNTDERAARGEDPPASRRKDRIEVWRPGYVEETAEITGDETLERSQTTKGKRAVRARIKPAPKDQGGD